MTDWIKHNGGPQPVDDETWVDVGLRDGRYLSGFMAGAVRPVSKAWPVDIVRYRILNQHLIDAARLEGIRLGLKAAATVVCGREIKAAPSLEKSGDCHPLAEGRFAGLAEATDLIRALNPETIAREALLDQLTSEAQADNMGYDND